MTAPAYHAHPEWATWLKAVRARPDDDTVRLIAADWLDEHGHGERAELVRVAAELAKHCRHCAELVRRAVPHYYPDVDYRRLAAPARCWKCNPLMMRDEELIRVADAGIGWPPEWANRAVWERGFLLNVIVSFAAWVQYAPAILPESVGLRVRLTDRPVVEYSAGNEYGLTETGARFWASRLIGAGGWASDWHPGHLTTEHLLRRQWPDVAAWEVPAETAVWRADGNAYRIEPTETASGLLATDFRTADFTPIVPHSIDAPPG